MQLVLYCQQCTEDGPFSFNVKNSLMPHDYTLQEI
jgi:hypothetical protein